MKLENSDNTVEIKKQKRDYKIEVSIVNMF